MFRQSTHLLLSHPANSRSLMANKITSFGSRKPKPVPMAYVSFEDTDVESNASPLLVIHKLFASSREWRNICRAIQEKTKPSRKVIAVDVRNHGESPHSPYHSYPHLSEDIVSFLKENDIERVSLLGHSMGGRAAMYTALKNPNLVERLIVADTSPITTSSNLLKMESIFPKIKTLITPSHLSLEDGQESLKRHLGRTLKNKSLLEFLVTNMQKTETGRFIWGQNVNVLHTNFRNMIHFPLEDLLAYQYREPTLFITGSKSDHLKSNEFDEIKRFFPKAELQFLDSGHEMHTEYPSEFAKIVVSFVNN